MNLYIDTRDSEEIIIGFNEKIVKEDSREERAQKLLSVIDQRLKREGIPLEDIKGIRVEEGPGSFTGLRVGTSVANALGWAFGIPVNGKSIKVNGPIVPIYFEKKK